MRVLLLMRSSNECPLLSSDEVAALSPRDRRLLTGLRLAYRDRGLASTLRDLELRPPDLDRDFRRLFRFGVTRCASAKNDVLMRIIVTLHTKQ